MLLIGCQFFYVSLVLPGVQVSHIEELYVYGNRVNSLPHEIAHLKKLKKLALNENLLSDLPGRVPDWRGM